MFGIFKGLFKKFNRFSAKHRKQKKVNYKAYMQSDAWEKKRTKRLIKDKYTCQDCGQVGHKQGNWLEVHHLTYKNLGNEKLNELLTLCVACHKAVHKQK
jgi:5-methylcytosine-specific restriction endonuclease McrA